jgi:hypothetical protein
MDSEPSTPFQFTDSYKRSSLERETSSTAMEGESRRKYHICSLLIFQSCDTGPGVEYGYTASLPLAKRCNPVSYPGAGHSLNFALNAQGAFKNITDCLTSHGL